MAHPVCLFFNHEDLPENFLKELMHISSNMISLGEVEREVRSAEFRGRLISQYRVGFYENFKGVIFYGEIFSKSKSYKLILLNGGENIKEDKKGELSFFRADSHEQISTILKHIDIVNKN
jgi:hypothetical protein